jgi:hypothetical protein
MYMLLHGWRACLSAKNRVRVDSCRRADPRVCRCVCVCVCECVRVRVCVCVCARVRARLLVWLCARACTACVNEQPRRCARPPIARRLAVFIARLAPRFAAVAFCATGRLSRLFGRRCHVDVPHGQRAVGRAIWAHVRGRRRRRHLRHRRLQRQRHRLFRRRVGEHRRRCAGRTRSRGYSRGYLGGTKGVPRGTKEVLRGTNGGPRGVPRGTTG